MPKDLFTISSFATLSGLVGLTYVITNGLTQAFGWRQTWLGLAVAVCCTELGVLISKGHAPIDFAIGVGNAFLVYLAAGGAAQAAITGVRAANSSVIRPQTANDPRGRKAFADYRFFSSWF